MNDEIFTVAEAADYLKVCEKTVRRLIKSQKLVASTVGSRALRIRKVDVDFYLTKNTNNTEGANLK